MRNLEDVDWSQIPAPQDDGDTAHLQGTPVPVVKLPSTAGGKVDLTELAGYCVVYIYPRTGRPDQALPTGWNMIPGARGCTPQSCAFRDHFTDLKNAGAQHLFGLSVQSTGYQKEAVQRMHLPFALLSDEAAQFSTALALPTFEADGMVLLKRMTLIIHNGIIVRVFYPVFPPDQDAENVISWLEENLSL